MPIESRETCWQDEEHNKEQDGHNEALEKNMPDPSPSVVCSRWREPQCSSEDDINDDGDHKENQQHLLFRWARQSRRQ